jgi:hypothetical protein
LGTAPCAERKDGPCQGSYPRVVVLHIVLGYILSKMFRRSISGMLAGLLIVAAVCMFVLMSGSVAVVAVAAFCLIAGVVWLCCELSDLRRGQYGARAENSSQGAAAPEESPGSWACTRTMTLGPSSAPGVFTSSQRQSRSSSRAGLSTAPRAAACTHMRAKILMTRCPERGAVNLILGGRCCAFAEKDLELIVMLTRCLP